MLDMEGEAGMDSKVLAVPTTKTLPPILPLCKYMKEASDLPPTLTAEIGHFFEQYKANEVGKWAKVSGWRGRAEAEKAISAGHCAERPQSAATGLQASVWPNSTLRTLSSVSSSLSNSSARS